MGIEVNRKSPDITCYGAYVLNPVSAEIDTILARITLLATGGAGNVYINTTNPEIATAPMNYTTIDMSKGSVEAAAKVGKTGSDGQIGAVVTRGSDGKLSVSEPVGDFILRGSDEVVTAAVKTLEQIDVGPERVDKIVKLRYLRADVVQKRLDLAPMDVAADRIVEDRPEQAFVLVTHIAVRHDGQGHCPW